MSPVAVYNPMDAAGGLRLPKVAAGREYVLQRIRHGWVSKKDDSERRRGDLKREQKRGQGGKHGIELGLARRQARHIEPGDVLMLNNMLTAHARNPYEGARKIAVAIGEMIRKDDLHDIAPDGLRAPERDGSARKDGAENQ